MGSASLDFLNMIKEQEKGSVSDAGGRSETCHKTVNLHKESREEQEQVNSGALIAVIDTETNWRDEVMSLGVALADAVTFKCVDKRYYIFEPESRIGGMYSCVMDRCDVRPITCMRDKAMDDLGEYLVERGVTKILAYNAKFDYGHLPELAGFEWYDIMRLAAYRQFNSAIPDNLPCCRTGRLKSNFGVEPILRMLSGDSLYTEVHNAVEDAVDELRIVELLGQKIEAYECGRIN